MYHILNEVKNPYLFFKTVFIFNSPLGRGVIAVGNDGVGFHPLKVTNFFIIEILPDCAGRRSAQDLMLRILFYTYNTRRTRLRLIPSSPQADAPVCKFYRKLRTQMVFLAPEGQVRLYILSVLQQTFRLIRI